MQLRLFQKACQTENITRAAEMMNISQPSVTNAIKDLEAEFGFKLINRKSKGFSLTKEGEAFLDYTNSLLSNVDEMIRSMSELGKNRKTVRVGTPPMIGSIFLPLFYKDFS